MPKLADTRTVPDLDAAKFLFADYARTDLEIAKRRAASDVRIARLKAEYEADVANLQEARAEQLRYLTAYILANRDKFEDPRSVKTDFGKFGLRDVSNLEVTDEAAVLAWAKNHGIDDVTKTTTALVKPAITKRLKCGDRIPGARIVRGEEVFATVDSALLDTIHPSQDAAIPQRAKSA